MNLNQGKLPITALRIRIRRYRRVKRKKAEADAIRRKIMARVGKRLERWVSDGKYRIDYGPMDRILEELGLTSDELSYFCARRFGMSFLSWRKELRIEDAKRMLLEFPETPACKIGQSLGISDKSNFRHQFKSSTGMTPSEWRKNHLK